VIETHQLTKIFQSRKRGRTVAVDRLDLQCRQGEIYALLGPNGAGKTTTLRILSTLIDPTSGEATVAGWDVRTEKSAIRRLIGVVSYETGVYERMTPREIGRYFGRLNDLDEATIARNLDYVIDLLRMRDFMDTRTDEFSTGMKQKTVVMRALVTAPEILIFDEPTAGLDLLTAKNVVDYIRLLRDEGKTILFSTHVLWEAEKLADTIGIIHDGKLIEQGTLDELRQRSGKDDLEDVFFSLIDGESPA
jgi:sodium transport system ATP-binding protein